MSQFLAQYLLNLWIYGSQALILFFAGRALYRRYETKRIHKLPTRVDLPNQSIS